MHPKYDKENNLELRNIASVLKTHQLKLFLDYFPFEKDVNLLQRRLLSIRMLCIQFG